jgi:hypothetical protein
MGRSVSLRLRKVIQSFPIDTRQSEFQKVQYSAHGRQTLDTTQIFIQWEFYEKYS